MVRSQPIVLPHLRNQSSKTPSRKTVEIYQDTIPARHEVGASHVRAATGGARSYGRYEGEGEGVEGGEGAEEAGMIPPRPTMVCAHMLTSL
jgi:hypothetical protein